MTTREELHKIIEVVPESDLPTTRKFLRSLVDPVQLAILNAPVDDEPESEEEREAVARALADPEPDIPFAEVRQRVAV